MKNQYLEGKHSVSVIITVKFDVNNHLINDRIINERFEQASCSKNVTLNPPSDK